jgi:hypothetical protein
MARVYGVREIMRDGRLIGKFRVTSFNDKSEDGIILGMCEHDHDTADEAQACPVVVQKLARIFPSLAECLDCAEAQKRVAEMVAEVTRTCDTCKRQPQCSEGDIGRCEYFPLGIGLECRYWEGRPKPAPAVEKTAEDMAERARVEELEKALRFYAGRLRADKNGYEFDDEPTHIQGGVARQALKGGK